LYTSMNRVSRSNQKERYLPLRLFFTRAWKSFQAERNLSLEPAASKEGADARSNIAARARHKARAVVRRMLGMSGILFHGHTFGQVARLVHILT
jgi:hypothetical protein